MSQRKAAARRGRQKPHGRAAKPRARRAPRRDRPALAAAALVAATARAAASLKTTLEDDPAVLGEEAVEEARQIDLLLGDQEDADPDPHDEEEIDMPETGPLARRGRRRTRPAPAIVTAGPAPVIAGPAKPPAGRGASGAHLFPRNLTMDYPVAVRAEGIWIHDAAGKKYLDGCGGAVVCSIGHGVAEIADVMTRQARRLAFAHSSQFVTRESQELADRIAALAPGDMKKDGRVYLVSGGSEAIETAIKMARQFHLDSGRPAKHKVIARWQSYHGSTMGALAITGNVARRQIYTPLFQSQPHIPPCYCYRCPFGLKVPGCNIACIEELEAAIHQEGPDTVAAFIAEPVVGATLGAVPAADGYWKRAREICDKHNVLLIADEVMTGIGRTGRNFAVDHWGVVPDLIVTGKGLSGGYAPLGAVIARGFVARAIQDGRGFFEHGYTYSANPLSAAVGSAVLDYLERHRLVRRAARYGALLGQRLRERFGRHPLVGDIRGLGMMWGVEIVKDRKSRTPFPPALRVARRVYDACMKEGLILYPGTGTREGQDGDHFIVSPAFTITRPEIEDLLDRLDRGLAAVRRSL
jgi:adenosylmethionine-8-amino-7-oxononanoate aminotransferase